MLTVSCVLKSGGPYDAEWVAKLQRGVERNLTRPHRFLCLSDVNVPCQRIPLKHDWPGWWSKIELFSGELQTPMLYLDLDTVITGSLDELVFPYDFAMLKSFSGGPVGSGVMWFRKTPTEVYKKFLRMPECYIEHHERHCEPTYVGDQAFIHDCLGDVDLIDLPQVRSYKRHCVKSLPEGTSVVCFHGVPKPTEVDHDWMQRSWV